MHQSRMLSPRSGGNRARRRAGAGLAAHLPRELAERLSRGGAGQKFSVWEFHERLASRAAVAPEQAARYARHVGVALGGRVPEKELTAAREELPREYWELAGRVLPAP